MTITILASSKYLQYGKKIIKYFRSEDQCDDKPIEDRNAMKTLLIIIKSKLKKSNARLSDGSERRAYIRYIYICKCEWAARTKFKEDREWSDADIFNGACVRELRQAHPFCSLGSHPEVREVVRY